MIHGIGTDIVAIDRMTQLLALNSNRFAKRILADHEYEQYLSCKEQAAFLAKRFVAKEAAAKALGTGFRDGLSLQDIYVTHNEQGKPLLNFTGRGAELIKEFGITDMHLSLSDEKEFAIAFVTLISEKS
jgi:holo-[acyl-carrier protein] synthase